MRSLLATQEYDLLLTDEAFQQVNICIKTQFLWSCLSKFNIKKSPEHDQECCHFVPNTCITISDVSDKTGMCGKGIKYIVSRPFSAHQWYRVKQYDCAQRTQI